MTHNQVHTEFVLKLKQDATCELVFYRFIMDSSSRNENSVSAVYRSRFFKVNVDRDVDWRHQLLFISLPENDRVSAIELYDAMNDCFMCFLYKHTRYLNPYNKRLERITTLHIDADEAGLDDVRNARDHNVFAKTPLRYIYQQLQAKSNVSTHGETEIVSTVLAPQKHVVFDVNVDSVKRYESRLDVCECIFEKHVWLNAAHWEHVREHVIVAPLQQTLLKVISGGVPQLKESFQALEESLTFDMFVGSDSDDNSNPSRRMKLRTQGLPTDIDICVDCLNVKTSYKLGELLTSQNMLFTLKEYILLAIHDAFRSSITQMYNRCKYTVHNFDFSDTGTVIVCADALLLNLSQSVFSPFRNLAVRRALYLDSFVRNFRFISKDATYIRSQRHVQQCAYDLFVIVHKQIVGVRHCTGETSGICNLNMYSDNADTLRHQAVRLYKYLTRSDVEHDNAATIQNLFHVCLQSTPIYCYVNICSGQMYIRHAMMTSNRWFEIPFTVSDRSKKIAVEKLTPFFE